MEIYEEEHFQVDNESDDSSNPLISSLFYLEEIDEIEEENENREKYSSQDPIKTIITTTTPPTTTEGIPTNRGYNLRSSLMSLFDKPNLPSSLTTNTTTTSTSTTNPTTNSTNTTTINELEERKSHHHHHKKTREELNEIEKQRFPFFFLLFLYLLLFFFFEIISRTKRINSQFDSLRSLLQVKNKQSFNIFFILFFTFYFSRIQTLQQKKINFLF